MAIVSLKMGGALRVWRSAGGEDADGIVLTIDVVDHDDSVSQRLFLTDDEVDAVVKELRKKGAAFNAAEREALGKVCPTCRATPGTFCGVDVVVGQWFHAARMPDGES